MAPLLRTRRIAQALVVALILAVLWRVDTVAAAGSPAPKTQVVAISCKTSNSKKIIGSGVLLDEKRVLTAHHVVRKCRNDGGTFEVLFPDKPANVEKAIVFTDTEKHYTAATPHKCRPDHDLALLDLVLSAPELNINNSLKVSIGPTKVRSSQTRFPRGSLPWIQAVNVGDESLRQDRGLHQGSRNAAMLWKNHNTGAEVSQIILNIRRGNSGGAVIYNDELVGLIVARDTYHDTSHTGEEDSVGYVLLLDQDTLNLEEKDPKTNAHKWSNKKCNEPSPKYQSVAPVSTKICDYELVQTGNEMSALDIVQRLVDSPGFDPDLYIDSYIKDRSSAFPYGHSFAPYALRTRESHEDILRIMLPVENLDGPLKLTNSDCSWPPKDSVDPLGLGHYRSHIKTMSVRVTPILDVKASKNEIALPPSLVDEKKKAFSLTWRENNLQLTFELTLSPVKTHGDPYIRNFKLAWLYSLLYNAANIADIQPTTSAY